MMIRQTQSLKTRTKREKGTTRDLNQKLQILKRTKLSPLKTNGVDIEVKSQSINKLMKMTWSLVLKEQWLKRVKCFMITLM